MQIALRLAALVGTSQFSALEARIRILASCATSEISGSTRVAMIMTIASIHMTSFGLSLGTNLPPRLVFDAEPEKLSMPAVSIHAIAHASFVGIKVWFQSLSSAFF